MLRKSLLITLLTVAFAGSVFAARQPKATTFDQMLTHYDAIRVSLVNDSMADVRVHANKIAALASGAEKPFRASVVGVTPSSSNQCVELLPKIRQAAAGVAKATDLDSARASFSTLSDALIAMKKMSSTDDVPTVYYCSMAKKSWMQPSDKVGNPYLGPKMASCGQVVK